MQERLMTGNQISIEDYLNRDYRHCDLLPFYELFAEGRPDDVATKPENPIYPPIIDPSVVIFHCVYCAGRHALDYECRSVFATYPAFDGWIHDVSIVQHR